MGGVFPDQLPSKVEIAWGASPDSDPRTWTWTDVTADVWTGSDEPAIDITRGASAEGSDLEPMSCSFTLDNHTGDYTVDNPRSRFYPNVKINSPVRVSTTDPDWGKTALQLPGGSWASAAYTNASAALTAAPLDVRFDIEPRSWRPLQDRIIASNWNPTDTNNQRWALSLWQSGQLEYVCIDTSGTVFRARSNAIPADSGRLTVAVQHDTTKGTVTFLTGPSTATADLTVNRVVTGAPTSLHTVTNWGFVVGGIGADVDPLRSKGHRFFPFAGSMYRAEMRNGINGTLVAAADFTAQPTGYTSFTDSVGTPWAVQTGARITDPRVRFVGIISSMPPSWPYGDLDQPDGTNGESTVAITATGEVRRQTAKGEVLSSALRRGFGDVRYRNDIVAYWPCEDGELSTTAAPGFAGSKYKPLVGWSTPPKFADYSDAVASGPLPTFTGTNVGLAQAVPTYTQYGIGYLRAMAYVNIPSTGVGGTSGARVLTFLCGGSLIAWGVDINSSGNLRIVAADPDGNVVVNTGFIGFNLNGQRGALWLYLYGINNGQAMKAQVGFASDAYGAGVGVYEVQPAAGQWFGNATAIGVGGQGDLGGMAIGHVAVLRTDQFWDTLNWVKAWAGEQAIPRMQRLAAEQGHGFFFNGVATDSARVGPQRIQSYLDLMKDAANADGGTLYEPRDAFGLAYRSRATLYNQDPALTLDAARENVGDIVNPFQPVADDSGMTNDVTVTRTDGSSVRVTDPAHIAANGTYATEQTVNVATDAQLPDIASWALREGTWPGMKYDSVSPALEGMPDLIPAWVATDIGDRVTVTNLPRQHPPNPVDLQVAGYSEKLKPKGWEATVNTTPGALWDSIGYVAADGDTTDTDPNRVDTEGSALAAAITATQTTITVAPTVGAAGWTTNTADMPVVVDVGGERMRVTAITAMAGGAQTFTVQRGVNGVTLARPAGSPVRLAQPAYVPW